MYFSYSRHAQTVAMVGYRRLKLELWCCIVSWISFFRVYKSQVSLPGPPPPQQQVQRRGQVLRQPRRHLARGERHLPRHRPALKAALKVPGGKNKKKTKEVSPAYSCWWSKSDFLSLCEKTRTNFVQWPAAGHYKKNTVVSLSLWFQNGVWPLLQQGGSKVQGGSSPTMISEWGVTPPSTGWFKK